MNVAVEGVQNGTYRSIDHAVKALGVSRTTLRRRLKGGKTRKEAREPTQLLTVQEEKALADWIINARQTPRKLLFACYSWCYFSCYFEL